MKIFIIDDDEQSIFLTETLLILKDNSLQIKSFLSGAEALEALAADDIPDIILLDLYMPVMDGWDFMDALAPVEQKISGSCNIYILSSCISDYNQFKAEEHPLVTGFMFKPITSENILQMLAQNTNLK